jgi:hypothetical protein
MTEILNRVLIIYPELDSGLKIVSDFELRILLK